MYSLTIMYSLALIFITIGLNRQVHSISDRIPHVSVIVAARNEEKNISSLLDALTNQDYPRKKMEIIIIDDESQDRTRQIIEKYKSQNVKLLRTTNRSQVVSPKKNALSLGIEKAVGEIVLLTDADCVPPECWISGMVRLFTPEVGMVIGFSPAESNKAQSITHKLVTLETLALAAVAAGTTGWRYPATCNGRNFAYRKSVFDQVGGFSPINKYISGDDDLLLKLVQKTDWQIRYAYDAQLVVPTKGPENISHFIRQRLRHASKGFSYEWKKVVTLFTVYLFNLALFIFVPLCLFTNSYAAIAIACMAVKLLFEYLLLYRFASHMKKTKYLSVFPIAAFLHVPYVVIFGLLGPVKTIKWK